MTTEKGTLAYYNKKGGMCVRLCGKNKKIARYINLQKLTKTDIGITWKSPKYTLFRSEGRKCWKLFEEIPAQGKSYQNMF